jgi:hypothetical protein
MHVLELWLALALAFVFLSSASAAGVSVAGHIRDPQGQPVPNAVVSLLNQGGVSVADATTSDDGLFKLILDNPGPYTIRVKAIGFQISANQLP